MRTHLDQIVAAAAEVHQVANHPRYGRVLAEVDAPGPFVPGVHRVSVVSDGATDAEFPQGIVWKHADRSTGSAWVLDEPIASALPSQYLSCVSDALAGVRGDLVRACRFYGVRRLRTRALSFDSPIGAVDLGASFDETAFGRMRHPDHGLVAVSARRRFDGRGYAFTVYLPEDAQRDEMERILRANDRKEAARVLDETLGSRLGDMAWFLHEAAAFALDEEGALIEEAAATLTAARARAKAARFDAFLAFAKTRPSLSSGPTFAEVAP